MLLLSEKLNMISQVMLHYILTIIVLIKINKLYSYADNKSIHREVEMREAITNVKASKLQPSIVVWFDWRQLQYQQNKVNLF